MTYGADYLGGCKYQKAMIANHTPGWAAGIFLRTFGDARKTVEAMVKSGKFSEIVVHIAPFQNDHNYPVKLSKQVREDLEFLGQFDPMIIWPSVYCENNLDKAQIYKVFEQIQSIKFFPHLINSIWKGAEHPKMITEIHIPNSKQLPKKPKQPYTVSFDGFGGDGSGNFTDTNIEAILDRYSDALHARWWDFFNNGKVRWDDRTPINQRESWPNSDYLLNRHAMMKQREGSIIWPKNALYKPSSDYHIGGSSKDGKAMCVLQAKKDSVNIRDSGGRVIDTMKRFQPDFEGPPKGARYYSNLFAYEIAALASQNTGSTLVKIDEMLLTDANLRSNLFR